jgi:hypothetical protein
MNNKPTCHPDMPESGQQKPRFYFRPISFEGTLTHKRSRRLRRFFSDKAMKRRERRKKIKQMTYKLNRR